MEAYETYNLKKDLTLIAEGCYRPLPLGTSRPDLFLFILDKEMYNLTCKDCEESFYAAEEWKTYCRRCYAKMMQKANKESQEVRIQKIYIEKQIPLEMINRLIRLCHPDKHDNSKAANEVTVWLLAEREMAKESQ